METTTSTPEGMSGLETPNIGTTDKLFPEYAAEVTPPPAVEEPEPPKAEEPEPEVFETPVQNTRLSLDEHGDHIVTVKIDGVEKEVSFKDVLRGYQTDQYLTQKGQKLALERQTFEEMRRTVAPAKAPEPEEVDPLTEILQPYIKPFQAKIAALENALQEVSVVTAPAKYQQNLTNLDNRLKEEGFDDFMAYVPKIEDFIKSLPFEQQTQYDNQFAYIDLYKTYKIKDIVAKANQPHNPDPRPAPKVTPIEPVGGTPTGADTFQGQYKAAFDKARETGDWTEVFRLKGVIT
jgi:hypothetical protein